LIPRDLLKRIRRLEITTRRLVNDVFAGQYHSVFKGRGMEFSEVREYLPGDDVRAIDWNVTARMGKPYVKRFTEERELTVMLLVDRSGSGRFGSAWRTKEELAAEVAALLAFSAIRNNDRVGLIAFTDRIEKFVPPKKGRRHVLRLIREILYLEPEGRGTDIAHALRYLNRVTTRRTVAFVLSDFRDEGYLLPLEAASKRHDLIAFMLDDPRERELPKIGFATLRGLEDGEELVVDMSSRTVRAALHDGWMRARQGLVSEFGRRGVDFVTLSTNVPYAPKLMAFFRERARRAR
jgi:uncharacterized protein (DUF58 family)